MPNQVALITGGAKGIGRAIALDLASQHWAIAICYRTSTAAAEETSAAIVARGGQALALQCDVSDPAASKQLVEQVETRWGKIDALINGAGPYHRVNLFDETTTGWREMFDANLHPIFLSRASCGSRYESAETWTYYQFQHGQRRSDGGPAGSDGTLHR